MRTIERSTKFKRDYKRESKGRHSADLDEVLLPTLKNLSADVPLDAKLQVHNLSGNWAGYRECHLKPDLLLIYKKEDPDLLKLARLGSHSELFS